MLDQLVPDPDADIWGEVWSCLCHQMSVYTASFAALPRLTETARGWAPADRTMVLALCGAIVAGAEQVRKEAGDVRATYAAEIGELLRLVNETMCAPIGETDFIYMLQAALAFENVPVWDESLDRLVDGEYEVDECPGCQAHLYVVIGDDERFTTSGDYALDDAVPKGELSPAAPAELDDVARRIYGTADDLGQEDVAKKLLYVFGTGTCPDCDTRFSVAERIVSSYV